MNSPTDDSPDTELPGPPPGLPPGLIDHPDYVIERELGRGGMGVVYLARQKHTGRAEAWKVMYDGPAERPDLLPRFENEIKLVSRLHHPNVVRAYGSRKAGESLVLAMEHVDGHTLQYLVGQLGRLSLEQACSYAQQIAMGLQQAYLQGMVHRDIKPKNVMVTRGDEVKILDFGLAKAVSESKEAGLTYTGDGFGTPEYMAPEQALDAKSADIRADIYSLGCTLYHLLAGHPPFPGGSPMAVLLAHHTKQLPPLPVDCPRELADLLARMMAKRPDERPQTPGEVAWALQEIIQIHSALNIVNSIGMNLVRIPLGTFWMGSDDGLWDEKPRHEVTITRPFWLGVHPVTHRQWQTVMGANPSWFCETGGGRKRVEGIDTGNFPVECVSWHEAVEFCERLSAMPQERAKKHHYRLPTEAEWEHACLAGAMSRYHFGDAISPNQATFGRILDRPNAVGSYGPNSWGLHDMHGNVWEWCQDWYGENTYSRCPGSDPVGPPQGTSRVVRGGSWSSSGNNCRASSRSKGAPMSSDAVIGLRVARVPSG